MTKNTINHILLTGQSLSAGYNGWPPLSTSQPFKNLMLHKEELIPLTEHGVETPASALANTICALSAPPYPRILLTSHGVNGYPYKLLKKGTLPYQAGIRQVKSGMHTTTLQGFNYEIIGIACIHGESDHMNGNSAVYESYLHKWQKDYQKDISQILGEEKQIPFFTDQMCSYTVLGSEVSTSPIHKSFSRIPLAQLSASENNPLIYLVGPKYQLSYSDGVHLDAQGYRLLGEYYGKVMKQVLWDNKQWRPLSPERTELKDDSIVIKFHVPVPPLVLDTERVIKKENFGFECLEGETHITINSLSLENENTIRLNLSRKPDPRITRVRYALSGEADSLAGAMEIGSVGGNVRDSDPIIGTFTEKPLFNWLVQFEEELQPDF
ncbi:MAG: hypothetical protein HQK83_01210 [Fibrobacteria bacterium]|nr:hypothetical protein [Fibrobacteria bacterium]